MDEEFEGLPHGKRFHRDVRLVVSNVHGRRTVLRSCG